MVWIQHLGITCKNISDSLKFYTENFDLVKIRESIVPQKETKQIFGVDSPAHIVTLKAENNQEIELFEFPEANNNNCRMGNISHFALFVGNRRETLNKFIAKGLKTIYIDRGDNRFVYFAVDPDGNLIELRE